MFISLIELQLKSTQSFTKRIESNTKRLLYVYILYKYILRYTMLKDSISQIFYYCVRSAINPMDP